MPPSSPTETTYPVDSVAWSPDGSSIASANVAAIDVWDPGTGTLRLTEPLSSEELAWSPDSKRLAIGSGGVIKVWQMGPQGNVLDELTLAASEMTSGIHSLTLSPDGSEVIATSVGPEPVLKVWDVGSNGTAEIANFPVPRYFGDVAFTPDGKHILAARSSGRVAIWELNGEGTPRPIGAAVGEHFFDLSDDGEALAEVDLYDTRVTAWDVATGRLLFRYTNPGPVTSVAWSPDGELLVIAGARNSGATVVDRSGRVVLVIGRGHGLDDAIFSPDGASIATLGLPPSGGGVAIWNVASGTMIRSFPARGYGLAFDPTGSRIVTGGRWGTPEVWDTRTGQLLTLIESDEGHVCAVAFSPDGSRIAAGGEDDTTRIFDARTGEQSVVLRGSGATADLCVRSVAFSPDATMLATQNPGAVRIWALDIDVLLETAERNVTRSLTDLECRQYLHLERCPVDGASP